MRKQNTSLVIDQTLGCRPTHPLNESTCDLSHVDTGIDRFADVHQQVDTGNGQVTGEAINFDFCDRRALGEVEKWIAAPGFSIEVHTRCLVKTTGTKIDAFHSGLVGQICKRDSTAWLPRVTDHRISKHNMLGRRNQSIVGRSKQSSRKLGQTLFDNLTRIDRRCSIEIGSGRSRRW